jgi:hypothetical protein
MPSSVPTSVLTVIFVLLKLPVIALLVFISVGISPVLVVISVYLAATAFTNLSTTTLVLVLSALFGPLLLSQSCGQSILLFLIAYFSSSFLFATSELGLITRILLGLSLAGLPLAWFSTTKFLAVALSEYSVLISFLVGLPWIVFVIMLFRDTLLFSVSRASGF